LIENIQRVDLDAMEQAGAFARLIERHGYTHEALGRVIGRSQADVTRTLSLLRLPDEIRTEYEAHFRTVPKSVLVEVASVDDPALQRRLWNAVKDGGTVKALREAKRAGGVAPRPAPAPVLRLVAVAQRIAKDFAAIDERTLRDQRARIDEAQRRELERLHRLLGDLLG
ncbi:MAG TPA: chromosome partitioning protein, partial [Azospirillum sp.]|nr:chromosome partitioning protein [Azospirillum sp.]